LFDSTSTLLVYYDYGYNSSARIDYQFAAAGTYYLGVSG
jgi:hypothetical protein